MSDIILTGAEKTRLRGLGQLLAPALKLGKAGLTPAFLDELRRALDAHALVKLRFLGAGRRERAALCGQIAAGVRCVCVGAVGATALFYRPKKEN
jgi:RNA-binding protein